MDEDQTSGMLTQVHVEDKYVGKEYIHVFEGMLSAYGMIPIGLYRVDAYTGLPYVYTCPNPNDIIEKTDKIFAIVSYPCNKECAEFLGRMSSGTWFHAKSETDPSTPTAKSEDVIQSPEETGWKDAFELVS